ncbi:MAG: SOS response-associated peptidase [Chthoniobacteraceae bacterium]
MCGRYRLSQAELFAEMNDVRLGGNPFPKRYNIAPTQKVPVVLDESSDTFTIVRWGLIPSWAKDAKIASSLINARSETVAEKPAFRSAYKKRRCLVPADGFYEWQKSGTMKIPQHIFMRSGEPFAFAGLWEIWRDPATPDAESVRSFTILTTTPNEVLAPIHDRMPVILPRASYKAWLSADTSADDRKALLAPFVAQEMTAQPISTRVNTPRNDDTSIIEPVTTLFP